MPRTRQNPAEVMLMPPPVTGILTIEEARALPHEHYSIYWRPPMPLVQFNPPNEYAIVRLVE